MAYSKECIKKVNDGGWSLDENSNINTKWFEKNKCCPSFEKVATQLDFLEKIHNLEQFS